MKKILLTGSMALMGFMASAQFMVTTNLDFGGDEGFEFSSLTDNLGFGYSVNDAFMVGMTMADATADSIFVDGDGNTTVTENVGAVAEMQLLVRYYYNENLFISLTTPWSVETDLDNSPFDFARIGAGYSFNVMKNINIEPSYTLYISEWENLETGEVSRRGKFNLGVSANF
jgi:hypothetical protein